MNGSVFMRAPQDRFSVFWGVAGEGGRAGGPQGSTGSTDSDRQYGILKPATTRERGAGLGPAGALPDQEGEK
ncbi:MAG TPA: hypothetical protein VII83_07525 [Gaiellaceae bacterium]